MKLLHLFGNRRWTGPAEPAFNIAYALFRQGWGLTFVCGREKPGKKHSIFPRIRKAGIPTREDLYLSKHFNPVTNWLDARQLRTWLAEEQFGIIHCHLRGAHAAAAMAVRSLANRPLMIRTCYDGRGPRGLRDRHLLSYYTDGLFVVSNEALETAVKLSNLPRNRIWLIHTTIDLGRFSKKRGLGDFRNRLNISNKDFVVGIVARVQWRRRFDVFINAIELAHRRLPNLKAIVIGRGTNIVPIAKEPVRKRGLEKVILFPGYFRGDDYVRILDTMDVKVFLVPGTDGSCRAVREAMAMQKPVIAANRGMLPELVAHKERGLVIEDSARNLADAIVELALNPGTRRSMGAAGRSFAEEHFSLERQAKRVGRIYAELAGSPGSSPG